MKVKFLKDITIILKDITINSVIVISYKRGQTIDISHEVSHTIPASSWEILNYEINKEGALVASICESAYNPDQNDYSYYHYNLVPLASKQDFEIIE